MGSTGKYLDAEDHPDPSVPHGYDEQTVDLGEVRMNFAVAGGGTIAAWLCAFAKPGQVLGGDCEVAPFFASETDPAVGPSAASDSFPEVGHSMYRHDAKLFAGTVIEWADSAK